MRILLVSDIHSNFAALDAVAEPHDLALFLGDLVEYGVEPGPCVQWVREHCHYGVRGNHDHGCTQDVPSIPTLVHGFKYLTAASRPVNRERLSPADRRFLCDLPLTKFLTLDGRRFLLVHATPRDPLDEYGPCDEAFWAKRLDGVNADFVCVGHTHMPYALQVNNTLIVNPGSIGVQRDGDPRRGYGVLDGTSVELKRIEYPIEQAVAAVEASPMIDVAKEQLIHVYRHGKLPEHHKNNGVAHALQPSPAKVTA